MGYFVKHVQLDSNYQKFKSILETNDFIEEVYSSKESFYTDFCKILKKDESFDSKSSLSSVNNSSYFYLEYFLINFYSVFNLVG
jgi:hypothetical protein